MSARTIIRVAAATLILSAAVAPALADDTGLAYSHDLRRERGRLCMSEHYHFGSGSGSTKKAAEREAIRSWIDFTDFEYGSDWARFGRAASKGMSCSKGASGFDCQLQARPCR